MKKEAIAHGVWEDLANRNDNWDKLDGVPEKADLLMESKADKTEVDASLELKADKTYVDNQDDALTAQLAENAQRIDDLVATPVPTGEIIAEEIIDARQGKVSLGANISEIKALKANKKDLDFLNFPKYGEIDLPPDFIHNLDFNLWRDVDGKIKHNFDFDKRIEDYTTFYISETGSNANNGLTTGTPKRDLSLLIDQIEADSGVSKAKIVVLGGILSRGRITAARTITKDYAVVSEAGCIAGTFEPGLSWSLHASGVYVTTRTAATVVYDNKFKGIFNLPTRLTKVNSLADCIADKGTWYTDGTLVYVHRQDGSTINNNEVFVCLSQTNWQITFGANSTFMAKNITMLIGASNAPMFFRGTQNSKGNVIMQNMNIMSPLNTGSNGFDAEGIKSIWSFNCIAKDIARDGFNYHNTVDGDTFAFEYNCIAFDCGLENGSGNNNATTGHDAIRILRVGTKGWNTDGPLCADVNGCYSINIDCTMNDSKRLTGNIKSAYWFDDSPTLGVPVPNGKAILINCDGGGLDTFSINCDTSFKNEGKIVVDNFKGKNIPIDINVISLN